MNEWMLEWMIKNVCNWSNECMNNEGMKILGEIDVSASSSMLHRLGVS